MPIKDTIKRHLTIIKLLRKNKCSLKQVLYYLTEEANLTGFDLQISERTFKRDREDIEEINSQSANWYLPF